MTHEGAHRTGRRGATRTSRWRLVSVTGAKVVSPRRLDPMTRARVMLPSLITLGNMLCGFSSVLLSFQGRFAVASILVAISILFDISDGAVARLVGATTPFGLQFDSLADLVSFGIAPAVLVYTWALPQYEHLAWFGAVFWLACAAYRLARFNVTIDPLADKRYFIGLPSPGAAGVVIATVFAIDGPLQGWAPVLPVLASFVPAVLMATSFRFRSFRSLLTPKRLPVTGVIAVAVVVGMMLVPALTGLLLAYGYVLTCPLGWATVPMRRRWFGPDSVAPPRYRMPSVLLPITGPEPADETDPPGDKGDPDRHPDR
ncbi:CDP-diacylglycerol--serine O-phosphatidyltransferase [Intrasporangium sp.]|uniref:CDP-diacylglycerol--serine O-phosphatidyltransferase n=1 Tax=Intrasporangium sp. TaxID=1925024 RepID=UPI0032217778